MKEVRDNMDFERALSGSDHPVVRGFGIKQYIDEVVNSPLLSGRAREAILGGNALKLLKFE